jgi:hypothetical protein
MREAFFDIPFTNNRHFSSPGGESLREAGRLKEINVKDNDRFEASGSTSSVYGMEYD